MNKIKLTLFTSIFAFFLFGIEAKAQFVDFAFKDGISAAAKFAKDTLGQDAVLVAGGTISGQEFNGIKLDFNEKTGKASVWIYVFYSPTKQSSVPVITLLGGFLAQSLPVPLPLPDGLLKPLDMTLPFMGSDKAVAQMKTDTAHIRFKKDIPDSKPSTIFLADGAMQQDSLPTNVSFDFNQPIWSISYDGGGDSSLNCLIGGKDGKTFCQRLTIPVRGVSFEAATTVSEFVVAPMPVQTNAKIKFALKDISIRKGEIVLYNSTGNAIFRVNAEQEVNYVFSSQINANVLNNGTYYVKFNTEKGEMPLGKFVVNK